jgi:hypothetical protein
MMTSREYAIAQGWIVPNRPIARLSEKPAPDGGPSPRIPLPAGAVVLRMHPYDRARAEREARASLRRKPPAEWFEDAAE